MKCKRSIAVLLAVVMLIAAMPVAAFAGRTPGSWAVGEVNDANTAGLLTANAAKDFTRNLTRDEFCELVVLMVERALEDELPLPAANPFTDCNSEYVQKAYQFGIVTGKTATLFDPNATVLRQEIAAMMYRAINGVEKKLGKSLLSTPVSSLTFSDSNRIEPFAQEPFRYAVANGIFQGDTDNKINPLNPIISEECVAVIIRSHKSMETKINAGLTNTALLDKAIRNLKIGYAFGDSQSAVSQDVVLPTTGAGGAVITWSSGSPSVITSAGKIAAASGASAVLTATVTLGGSTRTTSFTLTTTTLTGDQLHVQNAKSALELGFYNTYDTLDSVTGRVFLPTTAMGLNVTWYSDRPSVVALSGAVAVPTDDSIITVNLTASFSAGTASATKVFTLKVRNSAFSSDSVSLHNVKLGMSLNEVVSALGSSKSSVTLATGETWYFFHSSNSYNNFIAVAMRANKVIGVYTMVSGWETYLRDSGTARTISVTEANSVNGVQVNVYTDNLNSNKQYAAFMYDTTTSVASERALGATASETFVTLLINAYRYLYGTGNGKNALTNDTVLSNSARSHSSDMDSYNYFSSTGRTGNSTYASRASTAGSMASVIGGVIAYNSINPFDFLNSMISGSADRSYILSTSAGHIGVGYSGSYTGAYKTLLTLVFASSTAITSVSADVSAVTMAKNSTSYVTLTFLPSGFTEDFTVESSNTSIFAVTLQSTPSTNTRYYKLTSGANEGTASLIVKNSAGTTLRTISVTVGTTYATSITAAHYLVEAGKTQQMSATTVPVSGPVVTWSLTTPYHATQTGSSYQKSVNSVSASGLATTTAVTGTATVRASTPSSASSSNPRTSDATIYVASLSLSSSKGTTIQVNETTTITPTISCGSLNTGFVYDYSTSNGAVATVNTSGVVTGNASGTAMITVTARRTGVSGSISKTYSVTVQNSQYPTGATASGSPLIIQKGESGTITITTTPSTVQNKIVKTSYQGSDLTIDTSSGNVVVTGNNVTSGAVNFYVFVQNSSNPQDVISIPVSVTVNPVTATVTINSQAQYTVGNSVTLYATTNSTAQITWSFVDGNGGTNTLSSAGAFEAIEAGTYTIRAEVAAVDGEYTSAFTTMQITIVAAPPVGP